mmetsp:Transcript_23596/g.54937  ORF Transcript_23596/g.54937 Transcript_23596/m.54937 type:complete len:149 (-) Transcript_23596:53-499(-)
MHRAVLHLSPNPQPGAAAETEAPQRWFEEGGSGGTTGLETSVADPREVLRRIAEETQIVQESLSYADEAGRKATSRRNNLEAELRNAGNQLTEGRAQLKKMEAAFAHEQALLSALEQLTAQEDWLGLTRLQDPASGMVFDLSASSGGA